MSRDKLNPLRAGRTARNGARDFVKRAADGRESRPSPAKRMRRVRPDPPLAAKLAPLVARLASDSDAEVLACVRAIRRLLEARGFDLNDLAAMLARSERVRISRGASVGAGDLGPARPLDRRA